MKKIFLLFAATIALAACDNVDDSQTEYSGALKITASIGESVASRASNTEWADGDKIGISSIVGDVAGPFINYEYTHSGDGVFHGTPIFYYKPMTLIAYYPFTGTEGQVPGENGFIAANTRPENQTAKNQPNIDFLWDSKTGIDKKDFSVSDSIVEFKFAHKMSKISFTFESSDPVYDDNDPLVMLSEGVDVATMISYEIAGLGVEGTFDTATGVCAIDESKEREGLKISFAKHPTPDIEKRKMDPIIVFPQKKDDGFILHITTDELAEGSPTQKYKCPLQFTYNEILPGTHYIYTVKVTKRGLVVGELTIEPWVESERFITATIDGEVKDSD